MRVSFISFMLISSILFANNNDDGEFFKFGIGVTLEKSSDIYNDGFHRSNNIGFAKVILPIIYNSQLKFVPEIGLQSYKSYSSADYTLWQFGLGLYYFYPFHDINIYAGPRFSFEELDSKFFDYRKDDNSTYYSFGITLGAEYFLSENFSFGAELQINKYFIDQFGGYDYKIRHLSLVPVLYLSFYFK